MPKRTFIARRIADIDPLQWNALVGNNNPCIRHEFLNTLETQACLGSKVGWMPYHLVMENTEGQLLAACPSYVKSNSFGEFVFDWMFADAYTRAGMDYYPKMVVASPFTPASGPRLLIHPDYRKPELAHELIALGIASAEALGVSSLHWLFASDFELLESPHLLKRMGYQFHWHNTGAHTFDDYIAGFTAKRRKEIKRERRIVSESGINIQRRQGNTVDDMEWDQVYELYCLTFARYGNYPALSRSFFHTLASCMGENILLVTAHRNQELIAMAYFIIGSDCLYGRYWGAKEDIPCLHFEACYYQGLEYCLETGLSRFEPGAQGEHKISRGFLPTPTWSLHWIAHPTFRRAIAEYLERENRLIERKINDLFEYSPYRSC